MEVKLPDKLRILIVDDEEVVVETTRAVLELEGFAVEVARTVAEARAALATEVALVILDKNLPDGTGLDVLALLMDRWPNAQAILFTGFPSFDSAVEALRLGASDYVVKPLKHIDELTVKARRALERHVLLSERSRTLAKLAEAERLSAIASHSQMLAELGQLLASLVHELRSPLSYVTGNVDLVLTSIREGHPSGAEEIEALERALSGVEHVVRIIRDVRRITRVEEHGTAGMGTVAVTELVDRAQNLTAGAVRLKAKVVSEVPEGLEVRGQGVRLTQVLMNLFTNAAQAIPEYGTITVRAAPEGDRVKLTVTDDGSGMPQEVLDKIFEPFFTTKGKDEGTGLGLSVAKEIVEASSGTMHVESTPGEGTCFTIDLQKA